jgi:hypothetical protein
MLTLIQPGLILIRQDRGLAEHRPYRRRFLEHFPSLIDRVNIYPLPQDVDLRSRRPSYRYALYPGPKA